ncbi:MAG: tyrosine-type recombinase/integrase [Ketobacter sp.]|nr:tyrosine-type recombinase/integrase [Ketobacter sp.]
MARKRQKNSNHLPKYVMLRKGRYYLEPKGVLREMLGGKASFPLGRSYGDMFQEYNRLTKFFSEDTGSYTLSKLVHEYLSNVSAVEKAPSTYDTDVKTSRVILRIFAEFRPEDIRQKHIYQYQNKRKEQVSNRSVNKEISFLSGVLKYATQIGVIDQSPCVGIKYLKTKPRDRYVTDEELRAFYEYAKSKNPLVAEYVNFKYVSGRRDCELLTMRFDHVMSEGIISLVAKRLSQGERKPVLQEWTEDLQEAYEKLVAAAWVPSAATLKKKGYVPPKKSEYLISTRKGTPYTDSGWRSICNRLMKSAYDNGVLEERFTFHDIRAKTSSDIEDLEEASNVLAHSSIRTTKINYRRKIERIKALDRKGNSY